MIASIVAGIVALLAVVGKLIDMFNPSVQYKLDQKKKNDLKKEAAQAKMTEAAKKGDYDSFLDGRADKHGSD